MRATLRRSGRIPTPASPRGASGGLPRIRPARWCPPGSLALGVWSVLVAGVSLLAARRLAGAFASPLDLVWLAVSGTLLAVLAYAARPLNHGSVPVAETRRRVLLWRTAGCGTAALGAWALSLPATPPVGLLALWAPLVCAGLLALRETRQGGGGELAAVVGRFARRLAAPASRPAPARRTSRLVPPTQSLVRWESGGRDRLRGRLRVTLPSGRRAASAHVAFCPPFSAAPQVELARPTRSGIEISIGEVLPHGARFDVKARAAREQATTVAIEFKAESASD